MGKRVKVLSIETSTLCQSVAACVGDGEIVERSDVAGAPRRGHSRDLAASVRSLLDELGVTPLELDRIVVGTGPGSFTGLRVGLALAKGIAFGGHAKLVPTLAPASTAFALESGERLLWAMNAYRGLIYAAGISGRTGAPIVELGAYTPETLLSAVRSAGVERWQLAGDALEAYPELGRELDGYVVPRPDLQVPSARVALARWRALGGDRVEPDAVEPYYIRRSAAEEAKERAAAT